MKFQICVNIRHGGGGICRLEADIKFHDMPNPYPESTIYFEVDKANGYMLADDSYDAFVLVPLWLAMLHNQTLHIRGKISKRLYQNIKWYVQKILCDFYDALSPVKIIVDGLTANDKCGKIVGAGISCGVDSLSTIYDHFIREDDPDYRINALFYFDCGVLGQFGVSEDKMRELNLNRCDIAKQVANEIGLPCYHLKSNVDKFRALEDLTKVGPFLRFSCALSLGKALSRYYVSSDKTYNQIKSFAKFFHNKLMTGFCESYLVPLIQTERTDLILDGCQYRRVDKLKKIVDWDIAQKYLNVCWRYTPDGSNCGRCLKCLRTLLPLEIMGKLDAYANVFDVEQYRKNSLSYKIRCLQNYGEEPFETELIDFAKENNFPMPQEVKGYVLGQQVIVMN